MVGLSANGTAVLIVAFNRPRLLVQLIEALRAVKPLKVYCAIDGPRAANHDDVEKIALVKSALLEGIDWPCDLKIDAAESNLGCSRRVSSAVSWVLAQEDAVIVLEDDCMPSVSFFPFCTELLDRYKDDPSVMSISGSNCLSKWNAGNSYFFSKHFVAWGWATWARAWKHFDLSLAEWKTASARRELREYVNSARHYEILAKYLDQIIAGSLDTWDVPFAFAHDRQRAFCVLPAVNLIHNVGFGPDATHCFDADAKFAPSAEEMEFPLRHPSVVKADVEFDRRWLDTVFPVERKRNPIIEKITQKFRSVRHRLGIRRSNFRL